MKIIKFCPVLLIFLCIACSTPPSLVSYYVDSGVVQYFLPPTEWTAKGSKARLDITYRTGTDTPAIVNISFFGEKKIPLKVTSALLDGGGVRYPLEDISVLYPDPGKKMVRITSNGNRDTIASLFEADSITLTAEVDGVQYTYTPEKNFTKLKEDFSIVLLY